MGKFRYVKRSMNLKALLKVSTCGIFVCLFVFSQTKGSPVRVEIHLPRDQSGEVDFKALVLQLKETQLTRAS